MTMGSYIVPTDMSSTATSYISPYSANGTFLTEGANANLTSDAQQQSKWSREFTAVIATVLITAALVAIVGNVMVLTVIVRHRGMRTRTNLFLVNLAIADLLVGAILMPFSITTMISQRWLFGEGVLCQLNGWMNSFCLTTSIHTLMYIGVHKFFSIVHPFGRSHLELKTIVTMMAMAWLWSAIVSTLNVVGLEVEYKNGTSQCGPKYPDNVTAYVIHVILQLTVMIVPFFVLVYCYTKMFLEIKKHSARLRENSTVEDEYILATQKKVAVTLFIVLACFFMMALPYVLYATYTTVKKDKEFPGWINPSAYTFLYLNSMVNPIIYAFRSPAFREGYKEILCQTPNYVISDESEECNRHNRLALLVNTLRRASVSSVSRLGTAIGAHGRGSADITSIHSHSIISPSADGNGVVKLLSTEPRSPASPKSYSGTPLSPTSAAILAEKRSKLKKTRRKTLFELLRATRQSNAQSVVHRNGDMIIMKGGKIVSVHRREEPKQNRALLDRLADMAHNAALNGSLAESGKSAQDAKSEKDKSCTLTLLQEDEREGQSENEVNGVKENLLHAKKDTPLKTSSTCMDSKPIPGVHNGPVYKRYSNEATCNESNTVNSKPRTASGTEYTQNNPSQATKVSAPANPTVTQLKNSEHARKPKPKPRQLNLASCSPKPSSKSPTQPQPPPAAIFIDLDDEDHVKGVVPLSPATQEDLEKAMARPPSIHQSKTDPGPSLADLQGALETTDSNSNDLDVWSSCKSTPKINPAKLNSKAMSRSSDDVFVSASSLDSPQTPRPRRVLRLGSLEYLDPPSTIFSSRSFTNLRSNSSLDALRPPQQPDGSKSPQQRIRARIQQKLHLPSMKRLKRPSLKLKPRESTQL